MIILIHGKVSVKKHKNCTSIKTDHPTTTTILTFQYHVIGKVEQYYIIAAQTFFLMYLVSMKANFTI